MNRVHGVVHGLGPWGGPWTGPWGGPLTGSMNRVHGVVHGPWSMFCIRPTINSAILNFINRRQVLHNSNTLP